MMPRFALSCCIAVCLLLPCSVSQAQTPLDIQFNFNPNADPTFTPLFQAAETFWETVLPSFQDGTDTVGFGPFAQQISAGPIIVDAGVFAIDGVGGTLAQAGPNSGFTDNSGFFLPDAGELEFDSADIATLAAQGNLQDIIIHELGHVLGFGTTWELNGVYDSDTSSATSVGQYTGDLGLAAYNAEFGLNESFIPIENDFGPGTADGHFDEEFFGVALNSNPTVAAGGRFGPNQSEILTGVFNPNIPATFSVTTLATFQDIGFNVDFEALELINNPPPEAVPEPSSTAALAAIGLMWLRRRKRNA